MTRNEAEELLNLNGDYDEQAVKKAFKKLASENHPDINKDPGAEDKFKKINQAFQILSGKEAASDDRIENPFQQYNGTMEDLFTNFATNFHGFHKNEQGRTKNNRIILEDVEIPLNISFEEAVLGCSKKISYKIKHICDKCDGQKTDPTKRNACVACAGIGQVQKTIGGNNFFRIEQFPCPRCVGTGIIGEKCLACNGAGFSLEDASITVKIPAVGDKPVRIIAKEKGNKFKNFASAVYINVMPNIEGTGAYKGYYIEGKHVRSTVNVGLDVLLFGGQVSIFTVDKTNIQLEIPPMTKIFDELSIADHGVKANTPGKHIVTIDVTYPNKENINEELKIALENAYRK